MRWLELINVEYGDCTVLGGHQRNILMVDCGSVNHKLRHPPLDMGDVFRFVCTRYQNMALRYFLLTHYHRDHLCGFLQIIREQPDYFHRVFLPYLPTSTAGKPLLLEFALYAHLFAAPQSTSFQVNTSCLTLFLALSKRMDPQHIFLLKGGDHFVFDQVTYEVLWPPSENFVYDPSFCQAVDSLNDLFDIPYPTGCLTEFLQCKRQFIALYLRCQGAFSQRSASLAALLDALAVTFAQLENLRPALHLLPQAPAIRAILANQSVSEAYSAAANAASLVFQNVRLHASGGEDLLMTGDATPETLARVAEKLYDSYYIIKTPHHGTRSGFSPLFKTLSCAHLLISSGDYHAGGEIAPEYAAMEAMTHCTNPTKCNYFRDAQSCCNRLNYCYDQKGGTGLALTCPATKFAREHPGCGVYVIAPGRGRSCFCDKDF